jgi:hypothetical protein
MNSILYWVSVAMVSVVNGSGVYLAVQDGWYPQVVFHLGVVLGSVVLLRRLYSVVLR